VKEDHRNPLRKRDRTLRHLSQPWDCRLSPSRHTQLFPVQSRQIPGLMMVTWASSAKKRP
jgi:hypothetical protein